MPLRACVAFCALTILLQGCVGRTDESITETKNGAFKIEVRSQEVHNSGLRNIDACVADASSQGFSTGKARCFLHGYDFSGLSIKWQSPQEIDVAYDCGTVSLFRNYAIVPNDLHPTEFHVTLHENCPQPGNGLPPSQATKPSQ
jgi:hypothetical protein